MLALLAAWSARAQEAIPAESAPASATAASSASVAAPAPASAPNAPVAPVAPASAPVAAPAGEAPTIHVFVGLGGLLTYHATCVPVRIEITGGTRAFDGIVKLRSEQHDETMYEIPVTAEPGARRRLHEVVCAPTTMQWSWSLDGSTWTAITTSMSSSPPLVGVIGEDFGRLLNLEEALGGSSPQETRTAILAPDEAPVAAAAWSAAPVIVLDSRVASRLSAEALQALRDRIVAGGTLIVAGNEPTSAWPEIVAAAPSGSGPVTLIGPDGKGFSVPALQFASTTEWSASRPLGAGNLVMLGLDLRDPAVREALTPDEWRRLFLRSSAVQPPWEIGEPTWLQPVEAALDRDHDARASDSPLPPLLASIYLVAGGIALGVGSWVLGRKSKGIPRRRDVALLVLGISLPGFVAGFLRASAPVVPTTVIEYWPDLGRSRVISWTPVQRAGSFNLPAGASEALASGALTRTFPPATFRLGAKPSVRVADVPRFAELVVRTAEWQDMTPIPLAAVRASNPPTIALPQGVGPVSASSVMSPDMVLLGEIATAAASSGAGKGLVILEARDAGSPRVAWIVRESAP